MNVNKYRIFRTYRTNIMKNKTSFKGEKGREGETKKYIKKGRKKERKKEEG